jgi:hypothetical protein
MLAEGGSPEGAALSLIQRLEDLEAAVAALDTSSLGPVPELEPLEDPAEAPASPEGDAR